MAKIIFPYTAKNVFFVAGADVPTTLEVLVDVMPIPSTLRGSSVLEDGTVIIDKPGLYRLIEDDVRASHTLELVIPVPGLKAFTFTFG
jgi:hypothetical protein